MKPELIAPCGMNCGICIAYFGYRSDGGKRAKACIGCRPSRKSCAFIMKQCKYLPAKAVEFCFECQDFPCENLRKLDKRYRTKFRMSMLENLAFIKKSGIEKFLKQQKERFTCPECGGIICVHDRKCYNCLESRDERTSSTND